MNRWINKDGAVAVVYAVNDCAGWATQTVGYAEDRIFDCGLVNLLLGAASADSIREYCQRKWPDIENIPTTLRVTWIPKGEQFIILADRDGYETVISLSVEPIYTA